MVAMTAIAVAGLAMSAAGAQQAKAAGKRGSAAMRQNALMAASGSGRSAGAAIIHAEFVLQQGQEKADLVLAQAKQFRSSQKVAIAASGFLTGVGTAQAHMENTDKLAAADALAILHSAGNYAAAERASADAMIETGVAHAMGFVAQADAINTNAQASALSAWSSAAKYGFQAYNSMQTKTPNAGWSLNPAIVAGGATNQPGVYGPTPWGSNVGHT